MISSSAFCGEILAARLPGTSAMAVVAIRTPGKDILRIPACHSEVLHLAFHDVDPIRYPAQRNAVEQAPGKAEAENIWRWLQHLDGNARPVNLLCVCEAGMSRSAAIAEFVYRWRGIRHGGDAKQANLTLLRHLCELANIPFRPADWGLLVPTDLPLVNLG